MSGAADLNPRLFPGGCVVELRDGAEVVTFTAFYKGCQLVASIHRAGIDEIRTSVRCSFEGLDEFFATAIDGATLRRQDRAYGLTFTANPNTNQLYVAIERLGIPRSTIIACVGMAGLRELFSWCMRASRIHFVDNKMVGATSEDLAALLGVNRTIGISVGPDAEPELVVVNVIDDARRGES